jgi:Tfp pilus assembly protein PilO
MTKMRQWTLMAVIAVIIVLAGGWVLLVKPQQSKISTVKAQAATQQSANQVLLQQIAAREAQKKTLPSEQAQLQKLTTQVPTVPDEPGIIRALTSSAAGANVNLLSLTPGAVVPVTAATATTTLTTTSTTASSSSSGGSLIELPISMSVVGSYANIESYFQLLERLPRAILVTGFNLCPMNAAAVSGAACTGPVLPTGITAPPNGLGSTISADVFFSAAAATTPSTTTTLTSPTPGSTTAPTTTTPATTPASPAATTTPAPTASAAN